MATSNNLGRFDIPIGETWWRKSRHGPKQGGVLVEEIREVNPSQKEELAPYGDQSGFESVDAWQRAIRLLNDSMPATGYLYRVTKRD